MTILSERTKCIVDYIDDLRRWKTTIMKFSTLRYQNSNNELNKCFHNPWKYSVEIAAVVELFIYSLLRFTEITAGVKLFVKLQVGIRGLDLKKTVASS